MVKSSNQSDRSVKSTAEARDISRRTPPIPRPVLRALYRALLCAGGVRGGSTPKQRSVPDGMIVAATLPLGPQDLFIPPADALVFQQCEALGNSGAARSRFPQVLRTSPAAHWQVAMAMHLALGGKLRRRTAAVLAIVPEDFLAGVQGEATLQLLGEVSRQKLPVVYMTRTLGSHGAKRASDLQARGIPRIAVDGGDVVAIYRVCQEALRRAREGTGPTVVDCHFNGPADPVAFLESFLERYGLWSPAWKQQLLQEIRRGHAS
jgi:hypothetical protein